MNNLSPHPPSLFSLLLPLLPSFPSSLPSFLPVFSRGPLGIGAKLLFNPLVSFYPLDNRSIKDSHHHVQKWECIPAASLIHMLYDLEPRALTSVAVINRIYIYNYILQPTCQRYLKTITFLKDEFFKVIHYMNTKFYI